MYHDNWNSQHRNVSIVKGISLHTGGLKKQTLRCFGSLTLELGHLPVENELIASFPKSRRREGVTTTQQQLVFKIADVKVGLLRTAMAPNWLKYSEHVHAQTGAACGAKFAAHMTKHGNCIRGRNCGAKMAPWVSRSRSGAIGWRGRNGYHAQRSGRQGIKLAFQSVLRFFLRWCLFSWRSGLQPGLGYIL